jgi:type IV secretory pathway protease TraF
MKDLQRQIKRLRTGGIHAFVYEIPKNHYYLIGDNESVSEDSRNFGAVKVEDIFAKVIEK